MELSRWKFPEWELVGFLVQSLGFYSVGQGLGPAVRAVIVFCGWNRAVGSPQGK